MEERSVTHSTFVIERRYPTTPEPVFAAFAGPAKRRRWFAEGVGHQVEHFEMDFRVGGNERARFRFKDGTPLKGTALTNDAKLSGHCAQPSRCNCLYYDRRRKLLERLAKELTP